MNLVKRWHRAFGLPAPATPTIHDIEGARLRWVLIEEEMKEVEDEFSALLVALRGGQPPAVTVPIMQRLHKELCDLRYVAEGAMVSAGIDPDDAFEEVHRSNMSKLGEDGKPRFRPDGKVLKGPNYSPANPERMFPGVHAE